MKKKFLHLSDTHFLCRYPAAQEGYLPLLRAMAPFEERLAACLGLVDFTGLDFILFTGDLTEAGAAEDYAALRRFFHKHAGGVPLLVTPGNHDVKPAFYEGWLGKQASHAAYNVLWELGGLPVISLDSSRQGCPDGVFAAQSLAWLRQVLAGLAGRPSLLMTHHHLLGSQYELPPAEGSERLAEIVANSDILGVFCGHTHHNYAGWFAGKPYFTADSLSFVGRTTGHELLFAERCAAGLFCLEDGRFSVQRLFL